MPILTVFFPTANVSGEVRPEAQLPCVKPVDETAGTEANKSSNPAGELQPRGVMGVFVVLGVVGVSSVFG